MTEQLGPTRAQSNASSGGFRLSFPLVPVRVMGLFDESGELHPDECLSFPRQTAGCLLHREDFRTSEPRYPTYPHLLPPLSSLDCTCAPDYWLRTANPSPRHQSQTSATRGYAQAASAMSVTPKIICR